MPRHKIKMHDFWTVQSKDIVQQQKLVDSAEGGKPSLLVRVAATHAGIINGNMRFYRPDRMMDGCHTWLPSKGQFARPILIGHDDHGSVVGRVVEAKYIDESYHYKTQFSQLRDSIFYAADSKRKGDIFKTIDWIVENLMKLPDYAGLGYIELGLKVTNPEAVDKILRDEFLTVSVGFTTDSAICSLCHTDWATDDKCEHKPGEMKDGKQMFLISGGMDFEEVSFVNFPADPFAGVVSKEKIADGLARMKPFFLGLPVRQQAALSQTSGLRLSDSLYDADISIVEDRMPETVDPKIAAEVATIESTDLSQDEKDKVLAEAAGAPEAAKTDEAAAGTVATSDVLAEIFGKLSVSDAAKEKPTMKAIAALESAYSSADDDEKGIVRSVCSALVEKWYADGWLTYLKSRLAEEDSKVVVLAQDELDTKLTMALSEGIKTQQPKIEKAQTDLKTAQDNLATVFTNFKRALASQIVIGKMAAGADGFKGLSPEGVKTKIDELAKRHVSSLQDTVADLLSELKFTDAVAPANREETPAEEKITVNDNTTVTEPAAPAAEKTEEEKAGAAKELALHTARIMAMSDRERREYLAAERYKLATKKTK